MASTILLIIIMFSSSPGLLDTLDTQMEAKNCPGTCMHALAALLCNDVLEEVECPSPSMKCCADEKSNETLPTTQRPRPTRHTTVSDDDYDEPTTQPPQDKYKNSGNIACPGVCVEARLSQYCEAYLNSPDLCVKGRLCCVSKDNYGDRPPPDLVEYAGVRRIWFSTCKLLDETSDLELILPLQPPLPRCPGHCMHNIMAAFCNPPAVILQRTECNAEGWVCCDNTRVPPRTTRRPTTTTTTTTTTPAPADPRPDCPGSCIVSLLSFTCFPPYEPSYGTTLSSTEKYNKYVCGVKGTTARSGRRAGRVMGGEDGERGEWCWQVALINSLNQYLCGAALIGTQWVLTAAHCVTNIVRSGDAIYVRVGDHDLTRKYGSPGAQTLRVATTYIHHNHNSQTLDNDIALLKLHGKAELKEGVCLVCLPARGVSHAAGKRCTVTGYGYMGETGPIPLRVREAELPIVSDAECIRKVNAVTEKIFILPASSFCAGGEPGNDACQGDGGGPLVCQDDGFYELVGLVSWGFGCGRQDVPGVYVKVSSFIGWINQIISVNNL
ncbi:hypothetical protein HF086_011208 [Spodoptera exigua]|uniref:Peptidase S1 domain-containing protein n=1 Tax=Spodoptera exigua TaxID=7107 RepID=A0A922MUJ9_SPOEX|nr:hypothetical protein HF086_011208 [Spodoptera exigua]